jgi:hypothetical protein
MVNPRLNSYGHGGLRDCRWLLAPNCPVLRAGCALFIGHAPEPENSTVGFSQATSSPEREQRLLRLLSLDGKQAAVCSDGYIRSIHESPRLPSLPVSLDRSFSSQRRKKGKVKVTKTRRK